MAHFEQLTPNLLVKDVRETVDYYHNHFGFEVLSTVPASGRYDWAMMKKDDVLLMFQSVSSVKSKVIKRLRPGTTGSGATLYITLKNVRRLYDALKDDVEIIAELEETFFSALAFSVIDLNGYLITFSEQRD